MGRIGPNEVRGGPNLVSAQRRRRLCRVLRDALCGVLREGVRGVREVVRGCAEASSALEQGGLRDDCGGECCGGECCGGKCCGGKCCGGKCCGGKCCGGRAIGMEGGRGAAADGVAGRRGARVVVVVVVVSCGWPLAGLLRDCCGRLAGCGGSRVQAGAAVTGTCCGRLAALGEECSGGEMRGDCRFCRGMGRRMDVEELTGRWGFCPRGAGYRDGKQTGHSGGKGGRNEGAREWTWRLSGAGREDSGVDGLRSVPGQGDSGVVRPFAARYDRFFLLGGRPFAAVSPFIGSGPLQRCWQAFLGLNNPLPRCGAGFSRTGGDAQW